MNKLTHILADRKDPIYYLIISIIVAALGFIKSFVFMKNLELYDLGILAILQTIIMLPGLLQMGMLNGGYRILSMKKYEDEEKTNNMVFSSLLFTFILTILIIPLLSYTYSEISVQYLLSAVIVGFLSVLANWINNIYVAHRLLEELNRIRLITTLLSTSALVLVFYFKITGAIIALFVQPFMFVIWSLLINRQMRPTIILLNRKVFRRILFYGFLPYLMGVIGLIKIQIERWSISYYLGPEELGKYYIVILYMSLFMLIPNSLNNLFFPKSVQLYTSKNYLAVKRLMVKYFGVLISYVLLSITLTIFMMPVMVTQFLPNHSMNVHLVFYILPGLCLIVLSAPLSLIFNSSLKYNQMLVAYIISIVLNIVLIYYYKDANALTLENMASIKSMLNIYVAFHFGVIYLYLRKEIWSNDKSPQH